MKLLPFSYTIAGLSNTYIGTFVLFERLNFSASVCPFIYTLSIPALIPTNLYLSVGSDLEVSGSGFTTVIYSL